MVSDIREKPTGNIYGLPTLQHVRTDVGIIVIGVITLTQHHHNHFAVATMFAGDVHAHTEIRAVVLQKILA